MHQFPSPTRRAFTLIELLTSIAVIAILASITFFVVGRARELAKRAHCSSNLRQIGLALNRYATESHGRLPDNTNSGAWAWDVRYEIIERLGPPAELKDIAYCPAGNFPDTNLLWEFKGGVNGVRAIGYVLLLKGTPTVAPQDINERIDARTIKLESGQTIQIEPSKRELAVDGTISFGYGNFTDVHGMAPTSHRANHIDGSKPLGGNVVFLDGHVEWRPFAAMKNRAIAPTAWFWW